MKNIHKINNNIYITSDEEIKAGDCVILVDESGIAKVLEFKSGHVKAECFKNKVELAAGYYQLKEWKKIILTTDQDLIKDGIQAIDDEFLEWFVKNPSCESVKIDSYKTIYHTWLYKIIIPKEEPKQETLEEAAERIYDDNLFSYEKYRSGFIKGAKWQAERMYSKEEVEKAYIDAYHKGYNVGQKDAESHPLALTIANNIHKDKKEWFEQFKNK